MTTSRRRCESASTPTTSRPSRWWPATSRWRSCAASTALAPQPRCTTTSGRRWPRSGSRTSCRPTAVPGAPVRWTRMIVRKSPQEIEKMAEAGRVLARCLTMLRNKARPGVTTGELDLAAERFIRSQGGEPAFKGYRGFPGSICTSPNSMVVHGIPGAQELKRGDVVSLDVGVVREGWVADAAITVPIGAISAEARKLLETTRESLLEGTAQVRPGNHLSDVSAAIQRRVELDGFSIIRSLVGHGIGRDMHEEPQIPNYGEPGRGPELEEGMVLASEPMVNAGGPLVR